jgi:hypothetical protein
MKSVEIVWHSFQLPLSPAAFSRWPWFINNGRKNPG